MTLLLAAETGGHGTFSWWALVLGLVLLIANGFFVAAEISLLAARRARVEELADAGDPRARRALAALQELSVTFSGAQLGITMASLGLGAVAEPAVAALFDQWLGATALSAGARSAVAFGLALAVVVFLHMVVGEMAPKNLALTQAEATSLRIARLFSWFVTLLRPLIVALNATANGLVRLVGVEPVDEFKLVHTPDELRLALRESRRHGTLEVADVRTLTAVLRLGELDAAHAMTPRVDLDLVAHTAPVDEVLQRAGDTGHTRFPVVRADVDDIIGLVHVKDALLVESGDAAMTAAELLRPIPAVPESRNLEELLRDMQAERHHAVLVVDEFGGTAGLLTLEDVIEELVGDIADEFDPGQQPVRAAGAGIWVVPGTLRHDELQALAGLALPPGEAETVSGYLTERLGRLLRRGDEVEVNGWRLRVRSLEGRRAGEVEVTAPPRRGGRPLTEESQ